MRLLLDWLRPTIPLIDVEAPVPGSGLRYARRIPPLSLKVTMVIQPGEETVKLCSF